MTLTYDPIIKNGSFQITFGDTTKVYRAMNSEDARKKFAKFLKTSLGFLKYSRDAPAAISASA